MSRKRKASGGLADQGPAKVPKLTNAEKKLKHKSRTQTQDTQTTEPALAAAQEGADGQAVTADQVTDPKEDITEQKPTSAHDAELQSAEGLQTAHKTKKALKKKKEEEGKKRLQPAEDLGSISPEPAEKQDEGTLSTIVHQGAESEKAQKEAKGTNKTRARRERRERKEHKEAKIASKKRKGAILRATGKEKTPHPEWTVSDPVGGRLRNLDPVFSQDEEYLLLAYNHCVKVYACKTSLPVRTLTVSSGKLIIAAFAVSPMDPSKAFISLFGGRIEEWNWQEGKRITMWDVGLFLYDGLSVANVLDDKTRSEIVFVVDCDEGSRSLNNKNLNNRMITAHRFRSGSPKDGEDPSEVRTLFKTDDDIQHLQVLNNGLYIVAVCGRRVIVGKRKGKKCTPLKALYYVWREFQCSNPIACIDAHVSLDAAAQTDQSALDIAIGTHDGPIFYYKDLCTQLDLVEQKKARTPAVSRLHWHRNRVGSIKWSADGNYIISGGTETVLVLWQLDTGKKQLLPHLASAIESIVVSPTGSSYAIRLADNSTMILSTSELQPTFNYSGLQLGDLTPLPAFVKDRETGRIYSTNLLPERRPAVASIPASSRLLFAVPATLSSYVGAKQSRSSPYLQTIDSRSGAQLSKQALARTQITDRTMGPEGNVIEEPNVVLLRASHDGKWLATVDEWLPPVNDIQPLITSESETEKEVTRMRALETYLKFWSWNEETASWELVWRVDSPHKAEDPNIENFGLILDLIEDPSKLGFFTVGDDGSIKIWRPKIRRRNGLEVRDKRNRPLASWSCQRIDCSSAACGLSGYLGQIPKQIARLAASVDGSLLAVAYGPEDRPLLSLFNLQTMELISTRSDLISGAIVNIGLLGKHLVVLSDALMVWDIVNDAWSYGYSFHASPAVDDVHLSAHRHIAFDSVTETFAFANPYPHMPSRSNIIVYKTKIALFKPDHPTPFAVIEVPSLLRAVVPSVDPSSAQGAFTLVDKASQIQTLAPKSSLTLGPDLKAIKSKEEQKQPLLSGLENIFGKGMNLVSADPDTKPALLLSRADDDEGREESGQPARLSAIEAPAAPASSTQQQQQTQQKDELAEILASADEPLSLPPAHTMFERVVAAVHRANMTNKELPV